MAMNIVIWWY